MRSFILLTWTAGVLCAAFAQGIGDIVIDGQATGLDFDGLGAISGGGGNSRLLYDYPEPYRTEILDYLFKPGVGASLQLLKVEIGGDANSTDGAEPSHMHTAADQNYNRGYEWWLMEQAKARNPNIKLLALEWAAPGWIGNGVNFWSQDNVDYIVNWIKGAQTYHGLTIDYVGGWNECYTGWDTAWFGNLKSALAANGLSTQVIAVDEYYPHLTPSAQETISAPSFYDNIDIVATHYPCGFGPYMDCYLLPAIPGLTKPIWASENVGWDPVGIARATNLMYIDAKITASILWPLVDAEYPNLPYPGLGLILANQPWSGRYTVTPSVWAAAHTTQFVQPGWRYINGAAGRLSGQNGSYVAYAAPNGTDYSVVVETCYASSSQTFTFTVTGGLSAGPVEVWSTNLNSSSPDDWFVDAGPVTPVNGSYSLTLQPGFLYSITTTTGQGKANFPPAWPRRPKSLPLPYTDDFETYASGQEARLFSDMNGAFEVAPCGGGRVGNCLRQMSPAHPYFWRVTPELQKSGDPYTMIGEANWTDYRLSTDFLLEQSGAVQLLGRLGGQLWTSPSAIAGYVFQIDDHGNWAILRQGDQGNVATLTSGSTTPLGTNSWHTAALLVHGSAIGAEVDGVVMGAVTDSTYTAGNVGIGTVGWINAQFDNFSVTRLPGPTPLHPRRRS